MPDERSSTSNWFQPSSRVARPGDLALLITADQKRFLIRLAPHDLLHTHQGVFHHDALIGKPFGDLIASQAGNQALILEPGLSDLMRHLRRGTQIVYPKDAAYLVHRLSLRAGSRVIEAGTGSGGLTTALAWAVAPTGRVYTYEVRPENYELARKNLTRVALLPYIEMFQHSITDGFLQTDVDALFLDVREPWRFLAHVRAALRPGGFFASLMPTTNQVSELIAGLEQGGFGDIAVEELLLRAYKPAPDRLRPEDEMVAHTGYLVFARSVGATLDPRQWLSRERRRYQARVEAEARIAALEEERSRARAAGGPKYPRLPLPG